MHQEAFPGEDISDRPPPEDSVPGLLELIEGELPSGRYQARELAGRGEGRDERAGLRAPARRWRRPHRPRRGARAVTASGCWSPTRATGAISHARFDDLAGSAAARRPGGGQRLGDACRRRWPARRADGSAGPGALRHPGARARRALAGGGAALRPDGARPERGRAGETIRRRRVRRRRRRRARAGGAVRLRLAAAAGALGTAPGTVEELLDRDGEPIRYGYVRAAWPLEAYQNVYATTPGSAEMPSAGRPFTARLIAGLVARGVAVAPLTLHTGVSSPERHEPPFPEQYEVPAATARLVRDARRRAAA